MWLVLVVSNASNCYIDVNKSTSKNRYEPVASAQFQHPLYISVSINPQAFLDLPGYFEV